MLKPKVFVTRIIPSKGLDLVLEACDADIWQDQLPPSPAVLRARVQGVDGLLCLLTEQVDAELLEAAGPQLRVVSNHAVGYDNINVPACTARGIPVGNTPGILTDATADFTWALLLAAARHVVEGDRYVRDGKWLTWEPSLLLGSDLAGSTLGLIGFGRIGQAVARRAAGFGLRLIYHDPTAQADAGPSLGASPVDFDTLLAESDFVSLHVPLNASTYHLIDRTAFGKMKSGAVLVNTSRGGVIDPQALYDALKNRQIARAALDVTEPEPLPANHPLLELDNLVVVPHIASASEQTRSMMAYLAAQNLIAGVSGERLPHCVNPEVYEG